EALELADAHGVTISMDIGQYRAGVRRRAAIYAVRATRQLGGEARGRALAAARNLTVFFPEARVHAVIRAAAGGNPAPIVSASCAGPPGETGPGALPGPPYPRGLPMWLAMPGRPPSPSAARNLTSDAGGGPRDARHAGGPMTGLTSTTGVPSIASRASTSIRSPSRAMMLARCRPMGFGRLGEQVLNTPVRGWLMSPCRFALSPSPGPPSRP